MYDFSKLKLNPDAIFNILKQVGNTLVCTEDIQIVFPKRFDSRELNTYTDAIRILGIFAFVDTKGNYAVHNIPNRIVVNPNVIDSTTIDNEVYQVFTFYKGSVVSDNTTMVKDVSYLTDLYNEFIVLGKIPKFFSYTDILKTFKLTLKYNDSAVGKYNAPLQLLLSIIARDVNDKTKPYRYTNGEGRPGQVYYIGLSNLSYAVTNTINKISSGYFGQALFSAVGNEVEMSEVEKLVLT